MLWILSPFASPSVVARFGGESHAAWPDGVYLAPEALRLGFVALDRLPETPDTLWLRLLGRGQTLKQAIAELRARPPGESRRERALQLLASWRSNIISAGEPDEEDRELIMALSPAFLEWEQRTRQEGIEQGIERGVRLTLVSLLTARFGRLDSQLETVIEVFAQLGSEDYARQFPVLLSLSRDELIARFGAGSTTAGDP